MMRTLLHVLTRPDDQLANKVASLQSEDPQNKIEMLDLTVKEPNYRLLLEKIFEADSVQVW